jgi:two-component system, response regulator FlrC
MLAWRAGKGYNALMDMIADMLVVDDDRDILDSLRQIIESVGLTVVCAQNAEDALAKMAGWTYRFMLTDFNMPGMDGFWLAKRVSAFAPQMPIVMMTGNISMDISQLARDAGIAGVLYKPFNPMELLKVIQEHCPHYPPV